LKANERFIKFCFITGITKFSQLSIFSTINNLKNVTLLPRFSAGEVKTVFAEDIRRMAEVYQILLADSNNFQKIIWLFQTFPVILPQLITARI